MTEKNYNFTHTNDLHSHFENWPKIRRYLLEERQRYEAAGNQVLTLILVMQWIAHIR